MRTLKYITTLVLIVILSCNKERNNYVFQNGTLKNLKLNEVVTFEKEKGSKERLYDNTFALGEGFFPKDYKFKLSNPRVFERMDEKFYLESDYFCSVNDNLVRAIFYEWSDNDPKLDSVDSKVTSDLKLLRKKYTALKAYLTSKFGKPTEPKYEPGCKLFLISMREWKSKNMNVQLSLRTSSIRLVIIGK